MKPTLVKLANPIQHYAWGSRSAIARLQGRPSPTPDPEAELWIGDHRVAPSSVVDGDALVALPDWIARDPVGVLGDRRGQLPFLAKILAAARSLSVQVHPDAAQARRGFEREERLDLPGERRCYRDAHAKHEVLVALSEFEGLCGFRTEPDVEAALGACASAVLEAVAGELRGGDEPLAVGLFHRLQHLSPGEREALVADLARFAAASDTREARWTRRLLAEHPGDPLCSVPLLLNAVVLAPGEALVVRPGTVHAYLAGTGVEVMTPSDNVVRGGLTAKHVDPDELRAVTLPRAAPAEVLPASSGRDGVAGYATGTAAFALARLRPGDAPARSGAGAVLERAAHGVAVLLCVAGAVEVQGQPDAENVVALAAGEAALVPAGVERYRLVEAGAGSCVFEVSAPSR